MLHYINDIVLNRTSLLTLPKNLLNKILNYLSINDILKLFLLSREAKNIFDTIVWQGLYNRTQDNTDKITNNTKMSHDWKQLLKETKDIEMQYGFKKNPRIKSTTTIKPPIRRTLSQAKLSMKPQLEIIRTMSSPRTITEMNLLQTKKNIITNNKLNDDKYPLKYLSQGFNKEKKLVNIVNLEANDMNAQPNFKSNRNIFNKTNKNNPTDLMIKKSITKISTVPKINSVHTKTRNKINTLPKATASSRIKMDFSADSASLKCNEISVDDLVKRTLESINDTKDIFDCKFNWLDGLSSSDDGDLPEKYDKLSLSNKYKASRPSMLDNSKFPTNVESTILRSSSDQTLDDLSSWQAARLKAMKSSEILRTISTNKNVKSTIPRKFVGHRKRS